MFKPKVGDPVRFIKSALSVQPPEEKECIGKIGKVTELKPHNGDFCIEVKFKNGMHTNFKPSELAPAGRKDINKLSQV